VFALTAIVNVLAMGLSRRGQEIAGLRLIGARPRSIRALVLGETLLVTTVAVAVAAVLIALALIVYRRTARHVRASAGDRAVAGASAASSNVDAVAVSCGRAGW
jgi:ABC-type antimicrobial peptide transport system permease subunit